MQVAMHRWVSFWFCQSKDVFAKAFVLLFRSFPETTHRCGFFFDVFGLGLPDYLNCKILTDSNDPDVCIGLKEVQQAKIRAQRPSNLRQSNV